MSVTPAETALHVELILAQVRNYLDVRYASTSRINPKVKDLYEDLSWQLLNQLRFTLSSGKGFGPAKYIVADIICMDDQIKTKAVLNPISQVAILPEIVQQKEDMASGGGGHGSKAGKTVGGIEITDLGALYKAIDASLAKIVNLFQTYIWLNLENAADIVKFNVACQRVITLRRPSPELVARHVEDFKVQPSALTVDMLIAHELARAWETLEAFKFRRDNEEGYRIIIKREEQPDASPDHLIRLVGRQAMILDQIRERRDIDAGTRAYLAQGLGIAPELLTLEQAIATLEQQVTEGKSRPQGRAHRPDRRPPLRLQTLAIRPPQRKVRGRPPGPPTPETRRRRFRPAEVIRNQTLRAQTAENPPAKPRSRKGRPSPRISSRLCAFAGDDFPCSFFCVFCVFCG